MIISVAASVIVGVAIAADEYLHNQGFANEAPDIDSEEAEK